MLASAITGVLLLRPRRRRCCRWLRTPPRVFLEARESSFRRWRHRRAPRLLFIFTRREASWARRLAGRHSRRADEASTRSTPYGDEYTIFARCRMRVSSLRHSAPAPFAARDASPRSPPIEPIFTPRRVSRHARATAAITHFSAQYARLSTSRAYSRAKYRPARRGWSSHILPMHGDSHYADSLHFLLVWLCSFIEAQ